MRTFHTNWIFGTIQQDALWLLFPGPLFLLVISLLSPLSAIASLLIFVTFAFLDSGHVYLTWWRTLFNPRERRRTRLISIVPLVFLIIFTCLFSLGFKYVCSFVLYATAFHYIKQVVGFFHLYRRGKAKDKFQTVLFYFLMLMPFLAFHFRPDLAQSGFYTQDDLLLYPSEELYHYTLIVILVLQLFFFGIELRNYLQSKLSLSTVLYIFSLSWFYIVLFTSAQFSVPIILASLIVSHTIPYTRLMQASLVKTKPLSFMNRHKLILMTIVMTLIIFGGTEAYVERNYIDFQHQSLGFLKALMHGLYLVPLFFHFYFDGVIWKRNHPEFPHF